MQVLCYEFMSALVLLYLEDTVFEATFGILTLSVPFSTIFPKPWGKSCYIVLHVGLTLTYFQYFEEL